MKTLNSLSDVIFSSELDSAMKDSTFWQGSFLPEAAELVFSWEEINEIIFLQRIGSDRLRLSLLDKSSVPARKAFSSSSDGVGGTLSALLIDSFHECLESGATAVLDSVNEASYFLNKLAEDIFSRYRAKCAINAYMSFGVQPGFGAHHDEQDLIVVQIDGRKKWSFFGCNDSDCADVFTMGNPSEKDVSRRIVLERGDVLYVPKGVWHHAQGMGEPSLHLAIGLGYPNIGDFLRWVIHENRNSVPFEDIKVSDFRAEDVSLKVMNFLRAVCGAQGLKEFIDDYYSRIRCSRIRPDIYNRFSVKEGDEFVRVPAFFMKVIEDVDSRTVEVRALGRRFTLSIDESRLLDIFLKGSLSYRDVREIFSPERGQVEIDHMLSNLLKIGLITKVGVMKNRAAF